MRIIRVLWGADLPYVRYARLWDDIQRRIRGGTTCDQSVYVYGKDNADRLTKLIDNHYKVELVDESPYPFGMPDYKVRGREIARPWRYKHELIRQAVTDHGPVIYCDWDVQCYVKDVPAAFAMLDGRRFALSAFRYRTGEHHCPTRKGYAKQIVASGAWIFTRDEWLIDQVLASIRNPVRPRHWHDERVLCDLVDDWHGGWPGERVWLEKYESPIMVQQNAHNPWPVKRWFKHSGIVTRMTPIPFQWKMLFLGRGKWKCVDGQFAPCAF